MKINVEFNPGDVFDKDGYLQDGTQCIECKSIEDLHKALVTASHITTVDHVHLDFRTDNNELIDIIAAPFKGTMTAYSTFNINAEER